MYRRVTNVYRKPPIRSGGGLNQGKPQVLTYQNSRTQILAELSNLANPGPVQRDVTVTVAAGNINTVTVNRANVQTFFNGARQGDHTTAFVVYAAMFHNRLNGQTLVAARAVLNNIRAEILALPGYVNLAAAPAWAQAITNTELAAVTAARAAAIAAGAGVTLAQINAYASALLSFRNVIPLSAIEFGSVGHGEGHHNAQLQLLNNQLAAGNPLNAARRAKLMCSDWSTQILSVSIMRCRWEPLMLILCRECLLRARRLFPQIKQMLPLSICNPLKVRSPRSLLH